MVVIGCQWLFVTYGLRDPYLTDVPARPDRICECMYVVPSGLGMDRASPLFFAVSAAGCEGEKVSGSTAVCWASGREPAERERAQDQRVIRMTSRLMAVRCRARQRQRLEVRLQRQHRRTGGGSCRNTEHLSPRAPLATACSAVMTESRASQATRWAWRSTG